MCTFSFNIFCTYRPPYLVDENKKLKQRVYNLECEVFKSQQYNRRNNIEINGIPDDVSDAGLENKVKEVLKQIDVDVESHEIEASHRLVKSSNGAKTVIMKFVNRKTCEKIFHNKTKLKSVNKESLGFPADTRLYVHPNSCPYYSHLSWRCRRLKNARRIFSTWQAASGPIMIKFNKNSRPQKVFHEGNLDDMFPDFDFNQENQQSAPAINLSGSQGEGEK